MPKIIKKFQRQLLFLLILLLSSCTAIEVREFIHDLEEVYPDDNPLEEFVEYRIREATDFNIDLTPASKELTQEEKDIQDILKNTEDLLKEREYLMKLSKKLKLLEKKLKESQESNGYSLGDRVEEIEKQIKITDQDLQLQYMF